MSTFVVIASGPSLTEHDLATVYQSRAKTITVNTTYQAAPWADYYYSNDHDWFDTYIDDIIATADGTPVCGHETWRHPAVLSNWTIDRTLPGISDKPGILGWGGNSGFAAINLAWHLGATKIILLGFDLSWDGDRCHHHGKHPDHLQHKKPGFHRWLAYHDRAAKQYRHAGVDVVNCTRRTALKSYRMGVLADEL